MSAREYRLIYVIGTAEVLSHSPYATATSAALDGDDWLGQEEHHTHTAAETPLYFAVEDTATGDEVYRSGIGQEWPDD